MQSRAFTLLACLRFFSFSIWHDITTVKKIVLVAPIVGVVLLSCLVSDGVVLTLWCRDVVGVVVVETTAVDLCGSGDLGVGG